MVITDKSEFVSIVRSLHEREGPAKLDADTAAGLQEFIDKIPFYHKIELADGIFTPGFMTHEQSIVLRSVEKYITGGSRVLDVGCRDGLFTVAAHKKGAKEIVALDIDPSEGFREIVAPVFDMSNVQYLIGNFLDPSLEISGEFDFVIFAGLLYHLRYPFLGLRKAADLLKDGGMMILETAYLAELPDLPILLCPVGDFSPFEPTSVTFFNRRGLSDSLASFGLKVIDVVAEFTFILGNKTRYEEFQFPGAPIFPEKPPRLLERILRRLQKSAPTVPAPSPTRTNVGDSNVGRLVWVCQKTKEPIVPWTHPTLPPELVRKYWDLTVTTHNKPMWMGQRGVKSPET